MRLQGNHPFLRFEIHRRAGGALAKVPSRHVRKKLDARRAGISGKALGAFPKHQEVVGKQLMPGPQKTGRQTGFPKAAVAEKDHGPSVHDDGGGM